MENEIKKTSNINSNLYVNENTDDDDETKYNDISWSLTWTMAFPTLLPTRIFIDTYGENIISSPDDEKMKNQLVERQEKRNDITAKNCKTLHKENGNQNTFYHLPIPWCLLAYREIFGDVFGVETVQKLVDKQHQYSAINDYQIQDTSQDNNLGYGEITPKAVMELIVHIQSKFQSFHDRNESHIQKDTILDLGSGTGRVLFAAALMHHFHYVRGVEIVEDLHNDAIENKRKWESLHPFIDSDIEDPKYRHTQFTFLHEDITTYSKNPQSLKSGTGNDCVDDLNISSIVSSLHSQSFNIILIHATLFDVNLMKHVQRICEDCPKGTFFITVSKPLIVGGPVTGIELLEESHREMTWGFGTIYIQRKL